MKISKKVRTWCVPLLAGLLAVPCLSLMRSQAASRINLDESCSLTVSVGQIQDVEGNEGYAADFEEMEIPVDVYKVASVDETGLNYTPEDSFSGMDFGKIKNSPSQVTADDWQAFAKEAEEIRAGLPDGALAVAGRTVVQKEEGSTEAASGTVTGLEPGLYLVASQAVYNRDYTFQYTFEPYLTALPSSTYTLTGSGSDEWNYNTTIGLKPQAVQQYGELNIVKHLASFNSSLGRTTFVFRIEGRDASGQMKYEEVVAMDYTAAGGDQTLTVTGIPAGLTVTVQEEYSGASYEIVGSDTDTALIWSGQAVAAGVSGAQTAEVDFTNGYNGGNRGGYGAENHFFRADGEEDWNWNNPVTPVPTE